MGCGSSQARRSVLEVSNESAAASVDISILGVDEWVLIARELTSFACLRLCRVSHTMKVVVSRLPRLRLDKLRSPISATQAPVAIALFEKFSSLAALTLADDALSTEALHQLAMTISALKALRSLDVSHNGVGDGEGRLMKQVRSSKCPHRCL